MAAPIPDPDFWSRVLDFIWIPTVGAVGAYMTWLEKRFRSKANKEQVEAFQKASEERIELLEKIAENAFKKTDEVIAKHIEQDRENFVELFRRVDANKDLVNIKAEQIIEKINSNHIALLQILAAKQDRRSTDSK